MKLRSWFLFLVAATLGSGAAAAQAPAGSTGQCRDGSYTTAAKKSGACSGHKGVQTWFAESNTAPVTTNAAAPGQEPMKTGAPAQKPVTAPPSQSVMTGPTPPPSATPPQSKTSSQTGSRTPAPGGGPGMVWVNTPSKVYHCPGTEFYGTTKNGKYVSEADAISMGARADHNKPCPK